jgi:cellulose synthase operon protein C
MKHPCDDIGAFADGELPPGEAEAFREHLGTCAACQAELRDLMMLAAIAPGRAAARPERAPAPVIALAWYRRPRTLAVAALVAAAAVVVVMVRPEPPVLLAQAPTRAVEVRLAYGAADRHRPYDVARSAAP